MSIQNKIKKIRDALVTLEVPVYHYYSPSTTKAPYIVWYEEGESGSLEANNHKAEQAIEGYVEFFTQTEYDETADAIQEALNTTDGVAWRYESIIYGDPISEDNNIIHYTWTWSVI